MIGNHVNATSQIRKNNPRRTPGVKENINNGTQSLDPLAQFVRDLSINVPILYGMFSIVLALVLGVAAAIIRRFFSNMRKKYMNKTSPASQK